MAGIFPIEPQGPERHKLPTPEFAKLAEAANGYGETVSKVEDAGQALQRGLEHVRNGSSVVIVAVLPTLVEETSLQDMTNA